MKSFTWMFEKKNENPDLHTALETLDYLDMTGQSKIRQTETTSVGSNPQVTIATAADLQRELGNQRWLWPRWIPAGVVVGIAAGEGVGKTRFVADLLRRIYHGQPWPDGSPATLPKGSRMMWCPCDNNYSELAALPKAFDFPPEALLINANNTTKEEIFGDTLITKESLKTLEARIALARPAFLVIDTVTNASELSLTKPDEATMFYNPLKNLASKYDFSILALAHFNATGEVLGRRLKAIARVMIHLSQPDETQQDRRRLWVNKTFDIKPPPLGVTMSGSGNEYDSEPPSQPMTPYKEAGQKKPSPELKKCADWLMKRIAGDKERVTTLRKEAEEQGWGASTLYAARDWIGAIEDEKRPKCWYFKHVTEE